MYSPLDNTERNKRIKALRLEGCDWKQIMAALSISKGTVLGVLYRARLNAAGPLTERAASEAPRPVHQAPGYAEIVLGTTWRPRFQPSRTTPVMDIRLTRWNREHPHLVVAFNIRPDGTLSSTRRDIHPNYLLANYQPVPPQ